MGVLDRVFLFLYSLVIALFILLGTVCVVMLGVPAWYGERSIPFTFELEGNIWLYALWIVFGLVFFLLSLRFLWLSVKQDRLAENGIDQETEIGAVHISLTTIEEIVLRAAKQVKGVFNLKARVHYDEEKSNLSIGIKIEIDGKRPIQSVSEELQKIVKDQVEAIAGVEVDQVSIFVSQTNKSNQNRLRVS